LRNEPIIKPLIVAVVWAISTHLVPLVLFWEWEWTAGFASRILFIFALTMPFEIRDLEHDRRELGTIPQIFGIQTTKWIATLCLGIATALEVVDFNEDFFITLVIYLITLVMVWLTPQSNNDNYVTFWVEAITIVWFLLELLLR
jgi:4-hydroxybenzoate polyprenyltransferase